MRSPARSARWAAIVAGFTVVLLAPLAPLPRALAVAAQPWVVEFLLGILLVGTALVLRGRHESAASIPATIFVPLLLLIVWSALSAAWAPFPALTIHHTLLWAGYAAVFAFGGHLLERDGFRPISTVFCLVTLVVGAVAALDYLTLVDFPSVEGAIRQRYSKMAEMLVTILPLVVIAGIYARRALVRIALSLAALLGWGGVMLSLSKGAFLAGIIGFVILFAGCGLFSLKRIRKRVVISAGVWLVVTLAMQLVIPLVTTSPATVDYFTGKAGNRDLSNATRLLVWQVAGEMARTHPAVGVGADNFGVAVNRARASLATGRGPAREIAEDLALERAHNEPLQVLAELGIIGLILFAVPFAAFVVFAGRKLVRERRLSPALWAAFAGLAAFFASSMVSSFSFRAAQNGIAFFLVFAVAIYEIRKRTGSTYRPRQRTLVLTPAFLGLVMIGYFGSKAVAEYYTAQAEKAPGRAAAVANYEQAVSIDPGNANARLALGLAYAEDGRDRDAAAMIRSAIDRGLGVTPTYSILAKQYQLAGDAAAAERTFAEGTDIFPGSIFLRVDRAIFLERTGREDDAARELEIAERIDRRQANGWHALIREGSTAAFYRAQTDPDVAPPAQLWPDSAVRRFLDKTPGQ